MNNLWKKFRDMSGECYLNMIHADGDKCIWHDTFAVLVQLVSEERKKDPAFAPELYQLDEVSDYEYDISGWLEDYLDEMDMHGQYDKLQEACEKLIDMFQWKADSPSDYRFRIASAMKDRGNISDALTYCEGWYEKEPDDLLAATALIYARIAVKDFGPAEELVKKYISEDTDCTDENDIIFIAAEKLYQASGNKKGEKWVSQALEAFDQELEDYSMGMGEDDEDMLDDILPFN